MDLPWAGLRSLRELSRLGTMVAVAEVLGYTPGAISQQLAALERAAGRPLLVKVGRGVRLTDAGQALAAHAERILASEEEARRAFQAVGDDVTGSVRVGTFATSAATLLAPSIEEAARRHARLTVTSRELEVDAASSAVGRGDVDLAFGLDYTDAPVPRARGIELVRIASERFRLAVPDASAPPAPVSLRDAAGWDWILPPAASNYGLAIRAACRRVDFEPQVTHEVTDTAVSLALVARGLGVAPVTGMMLALGRAPGLTTVALREDVRRHVVLIRRIDDRRPSIGAITEIIDDVVRRAVTPVA